jgi:hypothetical protein
MIVSNLFDGSMEIEKVDELAQMERDEPARGKILT